MRRIARHDTGMQRIDLWSSGSEVEFRVAGATHAWWHRERFLTGLAWDNLAAAALLRPAAPPRSVLMLGLAGGTSLRVLRHLLPGVRLTAVDIDPGIIELAREHMELEALRAKIHLGDAYDWIRQYTGPRFDVVVDDVYQALDHDVARPGSWSERTGEVLKSLVAPGGMLVVNLVRGEGHRALQSEFRRFFRREFPHVCSVTTPAGLNEALAGAEALLGQASLRQWRGHFSTAKDREYWDRIRTKRLG